MRTTLLVAVVLIVAFCACRGQSSANIQFCNTTPQTVSIALAFEWADSQGSHRVSQGWYPIRPAMCETPYNFQAEVVWFYYARDSEDVSWNEPAENADFCVDLKRNFRYPGADSGPLCGAPVATRAFKGYPATKDIRTIALMSSDQSVGF